jgi:hypothetical protein
LSQTLDQRVPAFGRLLVGENVRVHERPVSWYTPLKTRRVGTTLVGVTCTALGYRPRYPNSTVLLIQSLHLGLAYHGSDLDP